MKEELEKLKLDCLWTNGSSEFKQSTRVAAIDSIIVLLKKGMPNQYIIYDYASTPRVLSNQKVIGASYEQMRVLDRWYIMIQGFD